jgi:peptide-methionine (S)-S-oxide reductase
MNQPGMEKKESFQVATFGGGCFWCTEAIFQKINGVIRIESGYSGGSVNNPSYQQVCTGTTGHAEVIQITFNPELISYEQLLEVFFLTHDPTTLNQQGADIGTQYRSVIFYHDNDQKRIATQTKQKMQDSGQWSNPIVTEISPLGNFYSAEDYHQDYFNRNQNQPYCLFTIAPKLAKTEKLFGELIED